MTALQLRDLHLDEVAAAAAVLGRGMRDNPIHLRVFGPDPAHRETALARLFLPVLRQVLPKGRILGGFRAGALVGVCGMVQPGSCRPTVREKLQILPVLVRDNPLRVTLAVLRWTGAWAQRDPSGAHWHLGPVAVDRDAQGQGIGSELLGVFCRAMDVAGATAYLETDRQENVRLYERFGFAVTEEAPVLGVPNWFMTRTARCLGASLPNARHSP